ncbi:hypothetical protein F2P56_036104 [Juglans regia]|uniref:Retrovirus-related Pol polyprotein from transposon TNT 1-94-like beta-barrel domain-containing protein n=1 Tax=Juglans regia TaxID=51240 RepID=A0A833WSS9_JUGRE|nr:hypothetical protein F2P56_036104 [Juglans regia]
MILILMNFYEASIKVDFSEASQEMRHLWDALKDSEKREDDLRRGVLALRGERSQLDGELASTISAYLRGQDLYGYVDGTLPCPSQFLPITTEFPTKQTNPKFLSWTRTDQLVLSILFTSLSDSISSHVLSAETSRALWLALMSMFTSQSQAKDFQIRYQLTHLSRRDQTISDYFGKVRNLADTLAATGSPIPEKDLVTYLLTGLGPAYESFVTSVTTRAEPLTSHELYQLLLVQENRLSHVSKILHEPSANFTSSRDTRGRAPFRGGRQGRGRGRHHSRGGRQVSQFSGNTHQAPSGPRPTCQVCQKSGHVALQCYHRFDHSYQYDPPQSFSANYTTSHNQTTNSDSTWYPDSAATHHITSDLGNLNLSSEPYHGPEAIRVGDGSCLPIQNLCDSLFHSNSSNFRLCNLLHVPNITKNLVSVLQFCIDNNCFFEFHSTHFSVKDTRTQKILLTGPTRNGLYVFPPSPSSSSSLQTSPSAALGDRTSVSNWHRRLGHPSLELSGRLHKALTNCQCGPLGPSSG